MDGNVEEAERVGQSLRCRPLPSGSRMGYLERPFYFYVHTRAPDLKAGRLQ